MGLSRDDYTKFSAHYEDLTIFKADPFGVLDQEGVGKLVKMAVDGGRSTRKDLEIASAASMAANRAPWISVSASA